MRLTALFAVLLCLGNTARGAEDDYQLGLGYRLNDQITLGGYFSFEYARGDNVDEIVLDDLALLAYGNLSPRFSYLVELESVGVYKKDFEAGTSDTNFPPAVERFYGDYKFSESANVRFGKFITPIGYWNLQPINVLRDTSSNPRYSRETFPKFVTGADLYGYTPFDSDLEYHMFGQVSQDIDDSYVNIQVDEHFGLVLSKQLTPAWHAGLSVGRYQQTDDTRASYFQVNSRLDLGSWRFSFEGIEDRLDRPNQRRENKRAMYLQAEKRLNSQHSLIARYDYLDDGLNDDNEEVGVLGYSYRPVFPVSLKAEYQWHSDSRFNQLLTSISVLF
ncbi:MAG: hypothetical protein KDI36_05405 [Pseudomonadales bacterium]|nr:hypothetical protein [Pseudomonadales bacterium]